MLPSGIPTSENTELSTEFFFCPSTLKLKQPGDSMQHFVQLLVKRAVALMAKNSDCWGERGAKNNSTPLRPLPLHPQYMNMSLLQTGLQSHQKQTREKPKQKN